MLKIRRDGFSRMGFNHVVVWEFIYFVQFLLSDSGATINMCKRVWQSVFVLVCVCVFVCEGDR